MITSLENEKVKLWKKIRTNKYINEYGLYIVEGEHLVNEAIKTNLISELIVLEGCSIKTELPLVYVSKRVMSSISLMPSYPDIMAVVKVSENNNIIGNKIILLDDVQDPGNVGTIIRTAVAFNVDTIILSNQSASIYNDKVIRASQGMTFHINIIRTDLFDAIKKIKEKGIPIYVADMDGENNLDALDKTSYAFILGNEGCGVKKELMDLSKTVKIPISNKCESLNVAIAGGIIMYELRS